MIIDIHGHIGRSGDPLADASEAAAFAAQAGLHRILISNLQAADKASGGQDAEEIDANATALDACQRFPKLAALYWVRPGRRDSNPKAVAGALETEPFVGLLLAPRHNEFNADDSRLDAYLGAVMQMHRPVLVIAGREDRARPQRIYNLAKRFPRLPFVVLHAAGDSQWKEAADCAQRAAAADDATLLLETAHVPADEIVSLVRFVDAQRVLFGSDACSHGGRAKEATAQIEAIRAGLPPAEAAAILGGNAAGLFLIPRDY
ncbi:MAG: amidohydrolase family protein [Planctomycetes bacterium]|nr:amidohydrolase family protein [Planctomycetota bacterium]